MGHECDVPVGRETCSSDRATLQKLPARYSLSHAPSLHFRNSSAIPRRSGGKSLRHGQSLLRYRARTRRRSCLPTPARSVFRNVRRLNTISSPIMGLRPMHSSKGQASSPPRKRGSIVSRMDSRFRGIDVTFDGAPRAATRATPAASLLLTFRRQPKAENVRAHSNRYELPAVHHVGHGRCFVFRTGGEVP
jgi:hypothetical protein